MSVKLYYPKEGDLHIGLTNGHTFVVPSDAAGAEVPKMFRKEAIARGALPVGMTEDDDAPNTFDRERAIFTALEQMMNGDEEGAFTTSGLPNLNALAKKVGFTVDRAEMARIWEKVQKSDDGSES
jgi:hypothetical protein